MDSGFLKPYPILTKLRKNNRISENLIVKLFWFRSAAIYIRNGRSFYQHAKHNKYPLSSGLTTKGNIKDLHEKNEMDNKIVQD